MISTCSGRCPGETSDPGAAAQGGHASARPFPGLGTKGLPGGEAASLLAALLPPQGPRRAAAAGAVTAAGEASSTLRLPAHPRPALPRGLGLQPQTGAAPVARRGAALAAQAASAAAWEADARACDRRLPKPRLGIGLPRRPNRRRPADQDPHRHRRAHPRSLGHPRSPPDRRRRHPSARSSRSSNGADRRHR